MVEPITPAPILHPIAEAPMGLTPRVWSRWFLQVQEQAGTPGPAGPQGEQGETGPTGATGPAGADATLGPTLTTIEALTGTLDTMLYFTGTDVAALSALSALARTLLGNATTAAMQSTLGLGTAAVEAYTPGTFTITATGFSTAVTGTARYVQVGKQVTLMVPTLTGTSNATTTTLTGIPAGLAPVSAFNLPLRITDNGTEAQGWIPTGAGTTTWNVIRPAAVPWTASGTKTVSAFTMAYLVA